MQYWSMDGTITYIINDYILWSYGDMVYAYCIKTITYTFFFQPSLTKNGIYWSDVISVWCHSPRKHSLPNPDMGDVLCLLAQDMHSIKEVSPQRIFYINQSLPSDSNMQ